MGTKIKYKGTKNIVRQRENKGVEYLTFEQIEETKIVEHLMTTRIGGVSKGDYSTMNFSYTRGDRKEDVDENYRRVAEILHGNVEDIVCTDQTHTCNIRVVTREDCGKGVVIPKDYRDIDGLITNEPGIILAFFYADCVPLFFVDPVKKAIGVAHSGWRGTVKKIGKCVVDKLVENYGTDPNDLICGIGTSICQDCYEVSVDVAENFYNSFKENVKQLQEKFNENISFYRSLPNCSLFDDNDINLEKLLLYKKDNGKYQLSLWFANFLVMLEAGVRPDNISVTDVCTCCNPQYLFSHRANGEKRGNLAAFMKLIDK